MPLSPHMWCHMLTVPARINSLLAIKDLYPFLFLSQPLSSLHDQFCDKPLCDWFPQMQWEQAIRHLIRYGIAFLCAIPKEIRMCTELWFLDSTWFIRQPFLMACCIASTSNLNYRHLTYEIELNGTRIIGSVCHALTDRWNFRWDVKLSDFLSRHLYR